jgi:hypothetical protein
MSKMNRATMIDVIELILAELKGLCREAYLRQEIETHIKAVLASARKGNRQLLPQAEKAIRLDPAKHFEFDSTNSASLVVNEYRWCAGRFETVSLGELKARALQPKTAGAQARLWAFDGASPATDVATLQASTADALFQVASQFNCLESPGPYIVNVENYFSDPTQGPRASLSAFPATLLRHYSAPNDDGTRFVQESDGPQIDLLEDACGRRVSQNGYFTGQNLGNPELILKALVDRFDKIRLGVHDNAQVMLGYNWDGEVPDSDIRRIAQVFTSTAAGGGYGAETYLRSSFTDISRQLLRAAYLGTLLAAINLGRKRVVLTLIGGGVFQNPIRLIWESIEWAIDEVRPFLAHDIDVIVNGYNFGSKTIVDECVVPGVRQRGGALVSFSNDGLRSIQL